MCVGAVAEEQAALVMSRSCGQPVEVLDARTPWDTLTALPSGDLTWATSTLASRAGGHGYWVPVDTALEVTAQGVVPAASVLPISFSAGGGQAPLARLEHTGRVLEMWWPGVLPEPGVTGSDAVYESVLPGVDLVMSVNEDGTGWSEVLVVRSPEAASNPALAKLSFPVEVSGGVDLMETSVGLAAVDGEGVEVFVSPTPLMWDSSGDVAVDVGSGESSRRRVDAPREGDRVSKMPLRYIDGVVTVVPDAAMLADPTVSWPVHIDPTWDAGEGVTLNAWAMIQSGFGGDDENYKNWSNEGLGHCDVETISSCNQDNTKRLLYKFNIPSGVRGSMVSSAEFSAYQNFAYDCDTGSVRLYQVASFSASTNWDNFHSQMDGLNYIASKYETRKSGCPLGPGWTTLNATTAARNAANGSWSTLSLGIRSYNETSMPASWKRFNSNATLSITFNRHPNTPGTPSLDPSTTVGSGPSGYLSRDATPLLSATVSDPDGGSVRGRFQIYDSGSVLLWEGLSGFVASGGTAQMTAGTTLSEGGLYTVRVYGNDGSLDSKSSSNEIQFAVDTTPPALPEVTAKTDEATVYVEDGWAGGVGVPGRFFFTSGGATDVDYYRYSFNSTALDLTADAVGANGQSPDVAFTPTTVGAQALRVVPVDRAGWTGPERFYRFNVDFPGQDGLWRLNEGAGTTAADTSGNGNALSLTDTFWTTGPFADFGLDPNDHALLFDSAADVASTAGPVAATNKSFTVMAFVKPEATSNTSVAVSQDGAFTSGFTLGHVNDPAQCTTISGICWHFSMFTADSATTGATVRATSSQEPAVGEWVHLTGVYDHTVGQLRLYTCVLGTPEQPGAAEPVLASNAHTSAWNAAGPLRVGSGQYRGSLTDSWSGVIDDTRVFDNVLSENEIRDICQGAA
jgi:hypothetical protein